MNASSPWKYVNKGLAAILGGLVLATIASIIFLSFTLRHLDSLITASGYSTRSALVLQDLTISLSNAANDAKQYVTGGDSGSLSAYSTSIKQVASDLTIIQSTPKFNLSAAQVKDLKSLSDQRITILQQEVTARTAGNQDTANSLIDGDQGSQMMAQIRNQLATISSQNQSQIRPRQQRSHNYLHRALWVAVAVSIFVLGICGVLIWYFQYTILRERALESTKNEFLSLASHQLRTPATNVKQYVGMLLDGYIGDLTDKQQDALRIAYKNNESEIRIMNDLLDVAKLDLQRTHLHKQRINVVSVVKQVVKDYKQYADNHDQKLVLSAPDELMAAVDRTYFKSVIEKLIDNALKYSHDKTRITVKVRLDEPNDMFEIVVKDQGLGIQKHEASKLFMKFSRLTNEFSANTEGSGLGLYWVKQIVKLHGGSIKVASQEGRGSKFTVRAPLT
jgi:signal transduction histidine kinase